MYISLSNLPVFESDEKKGMILDYDKNGNIVGIEVMSASKKIGTPTKMEYELA